MMSLACKKQAGFTMIEMAVAIGVFSAGMLVLLTSMERASDFSSESTALATNDSGAKKATTKLLDLFAESSIAHVDTMARFHSTTSIINFATDRFWSSSMRQCASASCGFHTRSDLSVDGTKYACSHEYRRGFGSTPIVMGKVFSADSRTCSFDGNQLMSGANLDGVRMLVSRSDGEFEMNSGQPTWRTMVFLFPRANDKGMMDLVRYEIRIEDLIAAGVSSSNWTRWIDAEVSWVDILDFGTDGSLDCSPDGSVPLTPETSDASEEMFTTVTSQDGPGVMFTKSVGVWGATYRHVSFIVNLESGSISFDIEHYENGTRSWTVNGESNRSPEVLVNDVTEFAVSTATSDPYDAATNPNGVEQDGVVRVHIGTSRKYRRDGEEMWGHHVDTFSVRPRN